MKFIRLFFIPTIFALFSVAVFANSRLNIVNGFSPRANVITQQKPWLYIFALSPNNKEIYAITKANTKETTNESRVSTLNIIDSTTGKTKKIISFPSKDNPSQSLGSIVFSLDGKTAYIADFAKNIYLIDTIKQEIIGLVSNKSAGTDFATPNNTVLSPDGNYLYAVDGLIGQSQQGPFIHIIDTRKKTVISKIKKQNVTDGAFGWFAAAFAFNHDASLLYISDMLEGKIDILDTRTNKLNEGIISYEPRISISDIALNPTDEKLFVLSWSGEVYITDTKNFQLIDKFEVDDDSLALMLNDDGTKLYVTSRKTNSVSVFETQKPYKRLKMITVGKQPQTLCLSNDHRQLYVGNAGSNSISVIDMTNDTVIRTISIS